MHREAYAQAIQSPAKDEHLQPWSAAHGHRCSACIMTSSLLKSLHGHADALSFLAMKLSACSDSNLGPDCTSFCRGGWLQRRAVPRRQNE